MAGILIAPLEVTSNLATGTVTVPGGGKLGHDVPPGTLNSILKQAGLK
jgi:predicted RNA binding protein YcfA (HicA-like mRNA interferase family)